jgi:hypothetical protein
MREIRRIEGYHLPVHDACLELCAQHQRAQHQRTQQAAKTESSEHLSVTVFKRLVSEYEDIGPSFKRDNLQGELQMLKADYGALKSFEWMTKVRMPKAAGLGTFVYHAKCCNKVRFCHFVLGHRLVFPRHSL